MPGHGVVAGGNGFSELYSREWIVSAIRRLVQATKTASTGMTADLKDGTFNGVRGDPADEVVIIDIEGRHRRHFDSFLLEQTAHLQVKFVPVGSEQGHP